MFTVHRLYQNTRAYSHLAVSPNTLYLYHFKPEILFEYTENCKCFSDKAHMKKVLLENESYIYIPTAKDKTGEIQFGGKDRGERGRVHIPNFFPKYDPP